MRGGWELKSLGTACEIKPPKSEVRRALSESDPVSFLPMEDLGIDQKFIVAKQVRPLSKVLGSYTYFADGDVLLAKITPCFENGKLGIAANLKNGIGFGSSEYIVLRASPGLDPQWLYYYLARSAFRAEGEARMGGAVGHKRLAMEFIESYRIPLPPLSEQRRIVAVLDEALAGIATAKVAAESNLQNAEALRAGLLRSVFDHRGSDARFDKVVSMPPDPFLAECNAGSTSGATRTGGRAAALRHIPGELSLSVGMPARGARPGWRWIELSMLARLESGHTPSRRHPEYWGGDIPWLSIGDARDHHGGYVRDTQEKTNELGIANSSARVLPAGTVCLSRTASVGYVTVTKEPMATSQDFVNWICSPGLNPDFLKFIFLAEGRSGLLRFASGAVHQTIYYPEAKAFHICCPSRPEQDKIVAQCETIAATTAQLAKLYQLKLAALGELKQSILQQAFSGRL